MTNINKIEMLPKKKPWFLMTKKEKDEQMALNIAHNKSLPQMSLDFATTTLVPSKSAKKKGIANDITRIF